MKRPENYFINRDQVKQVITGFNGSNGKHFARLIMGYYSKTQYSQYGPEYGCASVTREFDSEKDLNAFISKLNLISISQ